MSMIRLCKAVGMAVVLIGWASTAHATIIITDGPAGGNPDENVVYQGAGVVNGPATTVIGRTNTTSELVDITGTENLVASGGVGQATVDAEDGGFDFLHINADDSNQFFSAFKLNLEVDANSGGSFTVHACDQFATCEDKTIDFANGQNFFQVSVIDPELIAFVEISATHDVLHAKQLRVSLAQCDPTVEGQGCENITVPEPTSLALMGFGLMAGAWRLRRRSGPDA